MEGRLCLIVEDQPTNRERLVAVVGEAFTAVEVIAVANLRGARAWLAEDPRAQQLWLALIDLGLPDGSGIMLIRELKTAVPEAMLVVATIYDDDSHLFEALAAGAQGYLLKHGDMGDMTHYLKRIETGEPALTPSIARRLLQYFHGPDVPGRAAEIALTGRETETLTLLARGLTIAEAAQRLDLKPQTVAGYVKVIYQKLNVSSRAEATRKAVDRGLA